MLVFSQADTRGLTPTGWHLQLSRQAFFPVCCTHRFLLMSLSKIGEPTHLDIRFTGSYWNFKLETCTLIFDILSFYLKLFTIRLKVEYFPFNNYNTIVSNLVYDNHLLPLMDLVAGWRTHSSRVQAWRMLSNVQSVDIYEGFVGVTK